MMKTTQSFNKFFYLFIAVLFMIFSSFTIYFATLGWIFLRWDPLNLGYTARIIQSTIISSLINFICGMVTIFLLELLIYKETVVIKEARFFAIIVGISLSLYPIGLLPVTSSLITDSNIDPHNTQWVPLLTLYPVSLIFLTFLGFYLALSSPEHADEIRLKKWRDSIEERGIPGSKFLLIYIGNYLFFFFLFIVINLMDYLSPNFLTSYYLDNDFFSVIMFGTLFFPGLVIYSISFLIYFWNPIHSKISLSLHDCRLGKKTEERIAKEIRKPKSETKQYSIQRQQTRRRLLKLTKHLLVFIILFQTLFTLSILLYFKSEVLQFYAIFGCLVIWFIGVLVFMKGRKVFQNS